MLQLLHSKCVLCKMAIYRLRQVWHKVTHHTTNAGRGE